MKIFYIWRWSGNLKLGEKKINFQSQEANGSLVDKYKEKHIQPQQSQTDES